MEIKIPKVIQRLAPLWTMKIEKRRNFKMLHKVCTINGRTLDIALYNKCIVGEVHGFNSDSQSRSSAMYGCITCEKFAEEFDTDFINASIERFEEHLKAFEKHLKGRHKK